MGNTVFFVADDGTNGNELWKYDGVGAPVMVEDAVPGGGLNPGAASSNPNYLTNVNGTLFFSADGGTDGNELWKSNGTPAGTVQVADIRFGSASSSPQALANVNGILLFTATNTANNFELWKSNGGPSGPGGTEIAAALNPSGGSNPYDMTDVNGTLAFFAAADGTNFHAYKSDPPFTSASLIAGPNPGGNADPDHPVNVNGELLFQAFDPATGVELWKSDPPFATAQVVNAPSTTGGINAGAADSDASFFSAIGGTLLFAANDGTHGGELWRTESPFSTATRITDINVLGSSVGPTVNAGGTLFFIGLDGPPAAHGRELWKSEPPFSAVTRLTDLNPGPADSLDSTYELYSAGGGVMFRADDGVNGFEPWRSDGSAAGTRLIRDIDPGSGDSEPNSFTDLGGTTLFSATDGSVPTGHGYELWRTFIEPPAAAVAAAVTPAASPAPAAKRCKKKKKRPAATKKKCRKKRK